MLISTAHYSLIPPPRSASLLISEGGKFTPLCGLTAAWMFRAVVFLYRLFLPSPVCHGLTHTFLACPSHYCHEGEKFTPLCGLTAAFASRDVGASITLICYPLPLCPIPSLIRASSNQLAESICFQRSIYHIKH